MWYVDLNNFNRCNLSVIQRSHYVDMCIRTDHDHITKGTAADIGIADDDRAVGGSDN